MLDIPRIRICLPPRSEQTAICDFLDHETVRIDALIEEQNRLIELLEEKRESITYMFATKGIDKESDHTISEIPSIGSFPEHWHNVPIGSLLTQRQEKVRGRWPDTKLLSLTKGGLVERDTSDNSGKFPASFYDYQVVYPGDFVFCLFDMDETPRTVGIADQYGMVTGAYAVFRCKNENYTPYLYRLFLAIDDKKGMRPFYSGLRKSIRPSRFLRIKVPLPPQHEAQDLANRIIDQVGTMDEVMKEASRNIDLLYERRSALISAAVTGKIDLREWIRSTVSMEQAFPQTEEEGAGYG